MKKKPDSHKLPPHSLIFTNKAKEQNISIFFLFFCPKSISIFNTTAFCNRWTIHTDKANQGILRHFLHLQFDVISEDSALVKCTFSPSHLILP